MAFHLGQLAKYVEISIATQSVCFSIELLCLIWFALPPKLEPAQELRIPFRDPLVVLF